MFGGGAGGLVGTRVGVGGLVGGGTNGGVGVAGLVFTAVGRLLVGLESPGTVAVSVARTGSVGEGSAAVGVPRTGVAVMGSAAVGAIAVTVSAAAGVRDGVVAGGVPGFVVGITLVGNAGTVSVGSGITPPATSVLPAMAVTLSCGNGRPVSVGVGSSGGAT